jgi:cysteine desulfurase
MEHPSVARTMDYLEKLGFEIVRLSPKDAIDNFEQYIADNVTQDTILVSCMAVNNENGFKVDTEKLYRLVKNANSETIVHIDGVQGFCKVTLKGDLISLSGHKIHGFKGIGAMYCADKIRFTPLVYGGGQQKGMRSGTENVPAIAGLATAVKLIYNNDFESKIAHLYELKDYFIDELEKLPDVQVNSKKGTDSAPQIVSASFKGVRAEVLLHSLEDKEIYVSSGSACSSNKPGLSNTLVAIGLDKDLLDSTLRFSFCYETTKEELEYTIETLKQLLPMLRKYTRR